MYAKRPDLTPAAIFDQRLGKGADVGWCYLPSFQISAADLSLRELIGAYAGEIGQTQFLPSSCIKYGIDYDGDGHVDLRHSVPDVLASTANLLKINGWRAGAPFTEGTANFEVMREWNRSVVYRKTMVLFAEELAKP
jgi:membrane-bound lytic murein transglycosylase B